MLIGRVRRCCRSRCGRTQRMMRIRRHSCFPGWVDDDFYLKLKVTHYIYSVLVYSTWSYMQQLEGDEWCNLLFMLPVFSATGLVGWRSVPSTLLSNSSTETWCCHFFGTSRQKGRKLFYFLTIIVLVKIFNI